MNGIACVRQLNVHRLDGISIGNTRTTDQPNGREKKRNDTNRFLLQVFVSIVGAMFNETINLLQYGYLCRKKSNIFHLNSRRVSEVRPISH